MFRKSALGGHGICPSPHLGLDALEGLLQQQWEAPHLPLEPVVVVGEGPQRRLQCQQVGPDTCGDRRGVKPAGGEGGEGLRCGAGQGPSRPAHLPGSRARPSFPPGLWRRPPRWPGSCPPPGTASPPASARVPAPAPTRTWRSGSRGQKLNTWGFGGSGVGARKKPRFLPPQAHMHTYTHAYTHTYTHVHLSLTGLGAPCSFFPGLPRHQPGSWHITGAQAPGA